MGPKLSWRGRLFVIAQRLGRSLMLPIAALPVAALLVRFGQPDMLGSGGLGRHIETFNAVAKVLLAAGGAVMDNLPLLFAVGVAIGFARRSDGSTGIAAVVGYLTFSAVTRVLSPYIMGPPPPLTPTQLGCLRQVQPHTPIDYLSKDSLGLCNIGGQEFINYGVLGGILVGIVTALAWQKFHRFALPPVLAFFGGRRFVPIITAGISLLMGVVLSFVYPGFKLVFTEGISQVLSTGHNTVIGAAVFGTVQRMLIPLGLHHLVNAVPWFTVGQCVSPAGEILHGDLTCFFNGVDGSFRPHGWVPGAYMTGMFPIMMGGLPGAVCAMYRCVPKRQRKTVSALLISGALASFVTGVTEPIEFAFAYVAPPLYLLHCVLTGTSMAVCDLLGIRMGFGFSAGGVDYLVNFTRSAALSTGGVWGPVTLLAIAVLYFALYYAIFSVAIKMFDLPTPGRSARRLRGVEKPQE
ncbi:MAG: PTS transporter subunit EIIC [Actinomycetaceae bacterium]|nr:PTS transporter subunit EIIC [Actinomycetaceae bacterium]